MASTSISGSVFVIGIDDLKLLGRDFRRAYPEAARGASKKMREAAMIVAAEAKARVSYSKQIKVKPSVTRVFSAVVVASGRPAAPIENKGQGFVRHPVFGNRDVWTSKGSHPAYLAPALDSKIEEVAIAVGHVIDDAMRMIGFE